MLLHQKKFKTKNMIPGLTCDVTCQLSMHDNKPLSKRIPRIFQTGLQREYKPIESVLLNDKIHAKYRLYFPYQGPPVNYDMCMCNGSKSLRTL